MIILNWLMWFMFTISLMISLVTIIVAYGIRYIPMFVTLLPLEISLAITFLLWGINSLFDQNPGRVEKSNCRFSILKVCVILILGGVFLGFAYYGIY